MSLLSNLKTWREKAAAKEGVELFRVLPNAALEEIARMKPTTKDALMSIKGIKDAKYRKYGAAILALVAESSGAKKTNVGDSSTNDLRFTNSDVRKTTIGDDVDENSTLFELGIRKSKIENQESFESDSEIRKSEIPARPAGGESQKSSFEPLSVSRFLDGVNLELSGMAARVRGEVSSVDERERVTYFSIKDATDGSTLPCLIFRSAYAMSGVRLAIGDEVIVEGAPEIWKPMGKLSFKAGLIEYAGEGVLKKAYDALFAKLTVEGLLAPERKREIPAFPHRIALLTSRDGAAIGDFMMNVGRHGYVIDLYASSVEGARAVPELLAGVRQFNRYADRYDALVIIRGGGSLESLQAFNNEMLVREIALSKIPVIAGIGHEKDITLAALVADAMVSTPTAASRLVRQSWEEGVERVVRAEHGLRLRVADLVSGVRESLGQMDAALLGHFQGMKERIRTIVERFLAKRETLSYHFRSVSETLVALGNGLKKGKSSVLSDAGEKLSQIEKLLAQFDPTRVLAIGYSLVRLSSGKILRSSKDAEIGGMIKVRLSEGGIEAEVREIFD
jgi:exodeoxyribonuclease VII large subunit